MKLEVGKIYRDQSGLEWRCEENIFYCKRLEKPRDVDVIYGAHFNPNGSGDHQGHGIQLYEIKQNRQMSPDTFWKPKVPKRKFYRAALYGTKDTPTSKREYFTSDCWYETKQEFSGQFHVHEIEVIEWEERYLPE
jgi:hypothetical protein